MSPSQRLIDNTMLIFASVFVLSACCHCAVVAQQQDHEEEQVVQKIRGVQYCEILSGNPLTKEFRVTWNGTCPTNPGFYNVTAQDVRAVHGPLTVVKFNGVRESLMDEQIRQRSNKELDELPIYQYGSMYDSGTTGFQVTQIATTTIDLSTGDKPYNPISVSRYVTFIWKVGRTVYELINPDCTAIYVMQSFMIGGRDDAKPGIGIQDGENELRTLYDDGKIKPPTGWIYRSRVLTDDDGDLVIVGKDGMNWVLTDDMENAYSQMDTFDRNKLCPSSSTNDNLDDGSIDDDDDDEDDDANTDDHDDNESKCPCSPNEIICRIVNRVDCFFVDRPTGSGGGGGGGGLRPSPPRANTWH